MTYWYTWVRPLFFLSSLLVLGGCSGSSSGGAIDAAIGLIKGDGPILNALPGYIVQQTDTLAVDVNNVKNGDPGDDAAMTYVCIWDRIQDGAVSSTDTCDTLPGISHNFNAGQGKLSWTPSTSELGNFEIKITGTNKDGSDSRVFNVGVRLKFVGVESLTNIQGDKMDLNWTTNASAVAYQIMKKNSDGTFSLFQTVTNPAANTVTLTGLTPLTTYTWRVYALDSLGNSDGNSVSLAAITTDLVRLEVTAGTTQLSPGQSTIVTCILKDSGGTVLTTSGLAMTFSNDGTGTSAGTFGPTNDLGNGTYTATFTATSPGTLTNLTAAIPQYHYVQLKPTMTVLPLKIEILSSGATVNPGQTVNLTAKIRDFSGNLMTTSGHGLSFTYTGGSSTGTFGVVTDNGNGTYSAVFTGGSAGTAITFGATISTTSQIYATTNITVQAWNLEITSALADVSVTRTAVVTGKIKDWQGNYLTSGGKGMTLSISGAAGLASIGATTDVGDGTYTATITGLSLGTIAVTGAISQSHNVTVSSSVAIRKLRLEFLTSASDLMPGAAATLTGRVKDWQGNVVGVGGHAMTISTSGGSSTGVIGGIVDNGNGTYTTTFTAGSAGTATSVMGTISEVYQIDTSPTITVHKWRVFVSASSATVPVGQSITLTAIIKDYLGVQASLGGQSLNFSFSGGTSAGSLGTIVDNNNGTYVATFTGTNPGTAITATASLAQSYQVDLTGSVTVEAIRLALSVTQNSLNPGAGVTVQAQVQDSLGNSLTTGSYTIGFSYSGGTSTGSFGLTTNLGLGLYSTQFSGLNAGTATTVSANATVAYTVGNTVSLTVVPWKIEITASKTGFVINETGVLTAKIKDWQNNYLTAGGKGMNINLVAAGVGAVGSTVDNSDGTYTASFSASAQGTTGVTANISQSYIVTLAPTLTVEKVYIDVTVDTPEVPSGSVHSGSLITVTARLKNSVGTLVTGTGYVVSFSVSGGSSTVSQGVVSETSTGVYQANFQGVLAGTALTISAATSISHQLNSTATLMVTPGTVISATNSSLTTSAGTVRSGEGVTLTATLKDAAGNVMPGLSGVSFSNSGGTSSGSYGVVSDNGSGVYSSIFTGMIPGTATTVKASYLGVDVSTTVSETVTSGVPSTLTVSGPASVLANTCSTAFQLSFFDANSNSTTLSATTSFTFSGSNNARFYSDAACTVEIPQLDVLGGLAVSQFFYLKSLDPEALSITFANGGITQNPGAHSLTVIGTMNWIGMAGTIDSLSSLTTSNYYYNQGKYADGAFQGPYAMVKGNVGGVDYLFVTDYLQHTVSKIRISDGVLMGKIGRIANIVGASPTGGGAACTALAPNAVNISAGWCTGGIYQYSTAEGSFYNPAGITFLNGYLYIADYSNNRIVKVNADTGQWVGWSGKISTMPSGGTCNGETGTSSTWCLGGGGTTVASPQSGMSPNGNVAYGATATGLNGGNEYRGPIHMGTDGTSVFVDDYSNNRLVKIDPANGNLLGWMGWVYDNTGMACVSGNVPTSQSGQYATEFTDSWCTGGRSTNLAAAVVPGADVKWPKIGTGWRQVMGVDFYDDGTNFFMFISDAGAGRIMRYAQGTGEYRGWTGRSANLTGGSAVPAPPPAIATLMTGTCSSTAQSYTMGWCYGGSGQGVNNSNGLNTPYGIRAYSSGGTRSMLIANSGSINLTKMDLDTGVFQGYTGRVSAQPTGGASGCSTTASGSPTPGWCVGGTTTSGYGAGSYTYVNSLNGASNSIFSVETDGAKIFSVDYLNSRINIHNMAGAAQGALGLRMNLIPTKWQKAYTGVPSIGTLPNAAILNRDPLINMGYGVSYDSSYMYVADSGAHQIKRYNWLDGDFSGWIGVMSIFPPTGGDDACIGSVVGGMTPGWCKGGFSTSTAAAGFNAPRDLVSDGTNLYVADNSNHRIVKLRASDGLFLGWIGGVAVAGTPSDSLYDVPGCTGASNPDSTPHFCLGGTSVASNKANGFSSPRAIDGFVDPGDGFSPNHYYVIVADSGNYRIQKIDTTSGTSQGFVGRVSVAGTGNCATAGKMSDGWCLDGVMAVANTTSPSNYINNGYMSAPAGIWVDKSSYPYTVYVADNAYGKVQKFNAITGAFLGWIGTISTTTAHGCATAPTSGQATPGWCTGGTMAIPSSLTASNGQMTAPHGITGDATYIYVTDTSTHRINRFNKASGVFAGWKGRILTVPADGGGFTNPVACLSVSLGAGSITPDWCYGGTSQPGYEFDTNTPSLAAGMDTPRGLTIKGNYLIVVDSGNARVLQIPK